MASRTGKQGAIHSLLYLSRSLRSIGRMRILFISNQESQEERIRNELREFCEGHSISFCYSIDSAKDFITNNIIKNQTPLDLIITYSNVFWQTSDQLRDWIRFDYDRTYSKRDFNLREIPLAVIVAKDQNKSAFNNYNLCIDDIGIEKLNLFTTDFSITIKTCKLKNL